MSMSNSSAFFTVERALLPVFHLTTLRSLFPIDSLALTLLALDPLPLGEVEPKRGRGASAIYFCAICLRPLPSLGLTPHACEQGDVLRGWRTHLYDGE